MTLRVRTLGNGVITPFVKGVAATDATNAQGGASQRAVNLYCFFGVLGTGGIKATLIADEQAQTRLIRFD